MNTLHHTHSVKAKPVITDMFWVLFLLFSVHLTLAEAAFRDAQQTFEQQLDSIRGEAERNRARVLAQYTKDLAKVDAVLREKSDLEGLVALRDEKTRLQSERNLDESHVRSSPAVLAGVQKKTLGRLHAVALLKAKKVYAASRNYRKVLEAEKVKMVKSGAIDEAVAVSEAIETLSAQPDYQAAVALLKAEQAKNKRPPTVRPNPGTPSRIPVTRASVEQFGKEIRLYPQGGEPRVEAKRCKDLFTGQASKAVASKVRASLSEVYTRSARKEKMSYSKYTYTDHVYTPRITLQPGGREAFEKCTLIIDIFGKASSGPVRQDRQQIAIPKIVPRSVQVVDGQSYRYKETEYDYRYSSSSDEQYFSRPEYLGYVVSIFDDGGQLLYQRCTSKLLAEFAPDGLP